MIKITMHSIQLTKCYSNHYRESLQEGRSQENIFSILGFTKEKLLNIFWSMLLISALSAQDSLGFSFRNSLSKLLQSLGDFFKKRKKKLMSNH